MIGLNTLFTFLPWRVSKRFPLLVPASSVEEKEKTESHCAYKKRKFFFKTHSMKSRSIDRWIIRKFLSYRRTDTISSQYLSDINIELIIELFSHRVPSYVPSFPFHSRNEDSIWRFPRKF